MIGDVVQTRNIQSLNLTRLAQEFLLAPVLLLGAAVQIGEVNHHLLAVTDLEHIDKVRERLRIVGARTAADDDVLQSGAVLGIDRHAAEIQHVQNVGERQLILQGKADHVKLAQCIAALQSVERNAGVPHLVLHIQPRRKHALTPDIRLVVEQSVENPAAQMRHTDLIGVGEAQGKAEKDLVLLLDHRTPFAADIAGRLLHTGQNTF